MKAPKNLFIDAETIPVGERDPIEYPPKPIATDVKVGNRKGDNAEIYRMEQLPKLLEQYKEKCAELDLKAEERFRKRAVNSLQCEIICLGYALDDVEPKVMVGDEKQIMNEFNSLLEGFGDKMYSITFVGHNIKEFDLKLFFHRAFKYKLKSLMNLFRMMSREHVFDTMEKWAFFTYRDMTSLDNILRYLGIGGKGDIDGSKVYDLFLSGELYRIYDYCKKDVEDIKTLYKALNR